MGWSSQKDADEIKKFVNDENIDFAEIFSMVDVNGSETHPVYKFLKKQCSGAITSNFFKFFVDKNGKCQKFNSHIGFSTIECEITKKHL
jgi:glutathione peroxidase